MTRYKGDFNSRIKKASYFHEIRGHALKLLVSPTSSGPVAARQPRDVVRSPFMQHCQLQC